MPTDDLAAILERHRAVNMHDDETEPHFVCHHDMADWPCDVRRSCEIMGYEVQSAGMDLERALVVLREIACVGHGGEGYGPEPCCRARYFLDGIGREVLADPRRTFVRLLFVPSRTGRMGRTWTHGGVSRLQA